MELFFFFCLVSRLYQTHFYVLSFSPWTDFCLVHPFTEVELYMEIIYIKHRKAVIPTLHLMQVKACLLSSVHSCGYWLQGQRLTNYLLVAIALSLAFHSHLYLPIDISPICIFITLIRGHRISRLHGARVFYLPSPFIISVF